MVLSRLQLQLDAVVRDMLLYETSLKLELTLADKISIIDESETESILGTITVFVPILYFVLLSVLLLCSVHAT